MTREILWESETATDAEVTAVEIAMRLERAVRWRHLGVNKATFALPPSPNRRAPDPPSPAKAARLLNAAWEDPDWGLLLWLTMITGRRRGEVSALRLSSVDFERAQLIVGRSKVHPNSGVIEKETKSGTRPRRSSPERPVNKWPG